ncbi:hypothetical protein D9M70_476770 [compost metagenome]
MRWHDVVALDRHMHQPCAAVPRRRGHRHRRLERLGGGFRARPIIGEVIDHLLDPHGVTLRHLPFHQRAAHEGVGRGVDINREGGDRLGQNAFDRIAVGLAEVLAVFRRCDQALLLGDRRRLIGHLRLHATDGRQRGGAVARNAVGHCIHSGRCGLALHRCAGGRLQVFCLPLAREFICGRLFGRHLRLGPLPLHFLLRLVLQRDLLPALAERTVARQF